jgi:hypothetical protein
MEWDDRDDCKNGPKPPGYSKAKLLAGEYWLKTPLDKAARGFDEPKPK